MKTQQTPPPNHPQTPPPLSTRFPSPTRLDSFSLFVSFLLPSLSPPLPPPPLRQSRSSFAVLKGEISAFSAVPEIPSQSSGGLLGVYSPITED